MIGQKNFIIIDDTGEKNHFNYFLQTLKNWVRGATVILSLDYGNLKIK